MLIINSSQKNLVWLTLFNKDVGIEKTTYNSFFCLKRNIQTEHPSTGSHPKCLQWSGLSKATAGAKNSIQIFHRIDRVPGSWAIACCLESLCCKEAEVRSWLFTPSALMWNTGDTINIKCWPNGHASSIFNVQNYHSQITPDSPI